MNNKLTQKRLKKVLEYDYRLGQFTDFDEAVCHRLAAEQSLDWASCDDHSPAFQHVQSILIKS